MYRERLQEKLNEALKAVLPIVCIVLLLSFSAAPLPTSILLAFLFGALLLIFGVMFFTLGAELAMQPMGEQLGSGLTKSRRLWLLLPVGFLLGFLITISEPDLQVLADQVLSIPSRVLIFCVAGGVGLFLVLALLRMLFRISLRTLLLICYGVTFLLLVFAPRDFLAVAFDAGGVTTGPMTVPFIMAFGIGIGSIRSDSRAAEDSFGLIALCSIGPILTVLVLSLIFRPEDALYTATEIPVIDNSMTLASLFTKAFPSYLREIAISVLPIVAFYFIFRLIHLRVNRMNGNARSARRILIGLVYAYIGLVLFLTGSNVGFMPAGAYLGQTLAALPYRWIMIPLGMLIGYFIVAAEPAVYVLMKQVEELTSGAISGRSLKISLSIGVAASIGLAMLRVLTGVSIVWMLLPGYGVALLLSFFVPRLFTAIAFDSGGVVSGPMTATFLLPFAMGACVAVGGNVVTDAFGVVAMVAMTPLITIQILGLVSVLKQKQRRELPAQEAPDENYAIIEL
ncbi:MAG: DUF1538 domain-containing protein [Clostridia bacterium]|nr:DUF1538 domain-containing protein [Clostridia bacterium]